MSNIRTYLVQAAILSVLALWLLAPQPGKAADNSHPLKGKWSRVEKIAVMPFLKGGSAASKEKELKSTLDCQLMGLCYNKEDLRAGSEAIVTDICQSDLQNLLDGKVVPLSQVRDAYGDLPQREDKTPRQLAVALGKKLKADYVLVGLLSRYHDRVGGALSAESPASVAFSMFIVDVQTGQLSERASFDKTQTSLTENLFDAPMFFKKGMKWLSADELASYGVQRLLTQIFVR